MGYERGMALRYGRTAIRRRRGCTVEAAAVALIAAVAGGCSANASDAGRTAHGPGSDSLVDAGSESGEVDGVLADGGPSSTDDGPGSGDATDDRSPADPDNTEPDNQQPDPDSPVEGPQDDGSLPPLDTCAALIPVTSQFPRLLNREYDAVVRDLLGVTTLVGAAGKRPSELLAADSDGALTADAWNAYLSAADRVAAEVMAGANRSMFISCDPAAAGCLEQTIEDFGRKAFRRPVTSEEVARMMQFDDIQPKGTPDEVAEAILFAFLSSPSFIMLPELAQDKDPMTGAIKLSPYEVATRLSFLVWGSVPDEELRAAADAGELQTVAQIAAQAERMVQDRAKTGPQLTHFHRYYAQMDRVSRWNVTDHDPALYPDFASLGVVGPAMMAELDAMFEEVGFEGSFEDLFLSNAAFVNEVTAAIYDLNAADFGQTLTRVELDPKERPGFLTRVGFLSSFSNYDKTSPILRGAFVSRFILGVDPGAPIPDTGGPIPDGAFTTNREYTEALTSRPECSACHATYINPPGFVLEAYDAVGGVQVTDPRGGPIDTVADVTFGENDTRKINTPYELMAELVNAEGARRRYARQWVSFATGRSPNSDDECVVDTLTDRLASGAYSIRNVMTDLSQPDSFRLRVRAD